MTAIYEFIRMQFQQWAQVGMLPESFNYAFVTNSILCGIIIGPVLGGIGTMVVIKRLAFFSQAIGQAALTGVAIGIMLGEPYTSPYASMFGFCILFGLFMTCTKNRTQMQTDTLIGVYLSISLAAGACMLLYIVGKINIHILDSILFGSILTVNDTDLNVLLVICLLCIAVGASLLQQNAVGKPQSQPGVGTGRQSAISRLSFHHVGDGAHRGGRQDCRCRSCRGASTHSGRDRPQLQPFDQGLFLLQPCFFRLELRHRHHGAH